MEGKRFSFLDEALRHYDAISHRASSYRFAREIDISNRSDVISLTDSEAGETDSEAEEKEVAVPDEAQHENEGMRNAVFDEAARCHYDYSSSYRFARMPDISNISDVISLTDSEAEETEVDTDVDDSEKEIPLHNTEVAVPDEAQHENEIIGHLQNIGLEDAQPPKPSEAVGDAPEANPGGETAKDAQQPSGGGEKKGKGKKKKKSSKFNKKK